MADLKKDDNESSNLISSVIKELPKEVLKKGALYLVTIGFLFTGGYVSIKSIFPQTAFSVSVYAKLDNQASPGESIELYPPSLQSIVSKEMEVKWTLPFDQIAKRTIELHKIGKDVNGGLTRTVIAQLPIDDKPVVAFVFHK